VNAATIVADLHRAGIRLSCNGDRLHIEAKPGTITPEIRDRLAANKPELLAWLESPEAIRMRLLAIAQVEGIPTRFVQELPAGALVGCDRYSDELLGRWLHYRAASADPGHVVACSCRAWIAQGPTLD
jgi:TubC N-terminal docking domain